MLILNIIFYFVLFCVKLCDAFNSVLLLITNSSLDASGTKCLDLLNKIQHGYEQKEFWAIKGTPLYGKPCQDILVISTPTWLELKKILTRMVIDASGYLSSGFLWGNNYMLGSETACKLINNRNKIVLSNQYKHYHSPLLLTDYPNFLVNYRVIYASTQSQAQIDMQIYTKNIIHFGLCVPAICDNLELTRLMDNALNSNDLSDKSVNMNEFCIVLITILAVHILLAVVSAYIDGKVDHIPIIFKAFSIKKQWERLIQYKETDESELRVIHGLKVLSMIWILTGHTTFYSMASIDNLAMVLPDMTEIMKQTVFTSPTAVDSFFVMSGFLLSYITARNVNKVPKLKITLFTAGKIILYRYLRLTPTYVIVLLLTTVISSYLNQVSPYWMIEDNEANCKANWWKNLLYINNFYPMKEMCMSWSYYLSIDLQCFIIGAFLLFLYFRMRRIGLMLGFFCVNFTFLLISMLAIQEKFALSVDIAYHTLDLLYTPFWTRIGIFIVGMACGYYIAIQTTKVFLSKICMKMLTYTAVIIMHLVIYSQAYREEGTFVGPLIIGIGRLLWGWSIAWLIIAGSTGNLKSLENFSNKRITIILSRLTYVVYLINPICILFISMMMETPYHLSLIGTPLYAIGCIVVVYTVAIVFKLVFEEPYTMLIKSAFLELRTFFSCKTKNSNVTV